MLKKFRSYNQKNVSLWQQAIDECNQEIKKLEIEIANFEEHIAKLDQRNTDECRLIGRYKDQLEDKRARLTMIRVDADTLSKNLHNAAMFWQKLEENPKELTTQVATDILHAIEDYKKSSTLDDERIYVSFKNIKQKLKTILTHPIEHDDQNVIWRERYAILCGFVWSLFPLNHYVPFQDFFSDLTEKIHFANHEKLPDSVSQNTCKEKFDEFKKLNNAVFADEKIDLDSEKLRLFQESLRQIRKRAAESTDILHKQATRLANAIEKDVNADEVKKSKAAKAEVYTDILNKADLTLLDPIKNGGQVIKTATEVAGKPSTSEKVLGAVIAFVGAAVLTVSVLTFIGGGPFSALGAAIGTTLIAKAGVIAAGFVGAVVGIRGFGLFNHGLSKGVYKEIVKFDAAEQKMKEHYKHL